MSRSVGLFLVVFALAAAVDSAAVAQTMTPPMTATPDTHLVWLRSEQVSGVPSYTLVLPDTLWFGGEVRIEASLDPESLEIEVDDPFAVVEETVGSDEGVVLKMRLYWTGPMRLGWNEDRESLSDVFEVRGRVQDLEAVAPLRDPWRPVRNWWPLIGVALLVCLMLAALLWGARARRRRRLLRESDPVSDPAWMAFVRDVAPLVDDGFATPARIADDLGRLAAALQAYIRVRLLVKVGGLPTSDIPDAFAAQAYPLDQGVMIAEVLQRIDTARFRPAATTGSEARAIFADAFAAVERIAGIRTRLGAGAHEAGTTELDWRRMRERCEDWTKAKSGEVDDVV